MKVIMIINIYIALFFEVTKNAVNTHLTIPERSNVYASSVLQKELKCSYFLK